MNDRNNIAEFSLKSRIEIRATTESAEAVAVCEFGEDSDIAVVFELKAWNYWTLPVRSSVRFGFTVYARVAMLCVAWRVDVIESLRANL